MKILSHQISARLPTEVGGHRAALSGSCLGAGYHDEVLQKVPGLSEFIGKGQLLGAGPIPEPGIGRIPSRWAKIETY